MNLLSRNIKIQWWLWAAIFLAFFLSELLEKSMYIDGVWYAVIAQNLSTGKGSLWFPQFSETIFSTFHEHPPLMFWLQSFFFDLYGNHWMTERIYCTVQYILTSMLIVLFWKKILKNHPFLRHMWVLPLVLWQVNLGTYYFLPANLLENTLVIFDLIAIWLLFNFVEQEKNYFYLFFAACFLVMGLLTKGLIGLFPLAFFGIYWLVFRSVSLGKVFQYTTLLIACSICLLGLLFLGQPAALESLSNYWEVQVLASLKGTRRLYFFRESRFYILGQLSIVLLPMVILLLTNLGIIQFFKKRETGILSFFKSREGKSGQVFFLLGLSASLPIMISPRQALPYLLPSLPFFSIAFGICISFLFAGWWSDFIQKRKTFLPIIKGFSVLFTILAFFFCLHKYGTSNQRDKIVINDAEKIGAFVGSNKTIASTHYDMYISGYLMRFNAISIDTSNLEHQFLIIPKEEEQEKKGYYQIPIQTLKYNLYQKQR